MSREVKSCRIVIGLYDGGEEMGTPSVLPIIPTQSTSVGVSAVFGSKQNFPQ